MEDRLERAVAERQRLGRAEEQIDRPAAPAHKRPAAIQLTRRDVQPEYLPHLRLTDQIGQIDPRTDRHFQHPASPRLGPGQGPPAGGPHRFMRPPGYAGFLLLGLGLAIGYSSTIGLVAVPVLLLPGLVYRIHAEEALLTTQFGEAYLEYARRTRRLLPGIW